MSKGGWVVNWLVVKASKQGKRHGGGWIRVRDRVGKGLLST